MNRSFNISEWALAHRAFVWFLVIIIVAAGGLSYLRLGRNEDPNFTIKTMVVQVIWPGANITGFSNPPFSLVGKAFQISKEIAPGVARVAMITSATNGAAPSYFSVIDGLAQLLARRRVVLSWPEFPGLEHRPRPRPHLRRP